MLVYFSISALLLGSVLGADEKPIELCPSGSYVYRNYTNGNPVSCDKKNVNSCIPPFTCESNNNTTNGYCCVRQSTKAAGCPAGQTAYVNSTTKNVQLCKMWDSQTCPDSFYCQYSDINSQFQCCRLDAGCSNDGASEIDAKTGRIKVCETAKECGQSHQCEMSSTLHRKICCRPLKVVASAPAKPAFASIPTAPTVQLAKVDKSNKTQLSDTGAKPSCLDWLTNCRDIAANGQCSEGEGHWISCCDSCKRSLATEPESLCYDRLPNCEEFKSSTDGYCTHPSWSFDSQMNCYKTCYC